MLYKNKEVEKYTLRNAKGMEVVITNFGARVMSILVPDCSGVMRDVVLGFDSCEEYFPENHLSDFGALIGRYANRIKEGRILVDGNWIQLPCNNGPNCLHGGPDGWQYQVFDVVECSSDSIKLSLVSPDGDNDFPGEVEACVCYRLTEDNTLEIHYEAQTNATTVINLTNHSYFNLNADGNSDILNHILSIDADRYTPIDHTSIPLGMLDMVENTPMDFRQAKAVGKDIEADFEQLRRGSGYDHNWVLNNQGDISKPCARLESPITGIVMEVYTTEPGMQVYTGNFLDGVVGKRGERYGRRNAICLETQKFPDSPNNHWPMSNAYLHKGEKFESKTYFKFRVK